MEKNVLLNIIYLPDEATRNKAIELSRKVAANLPVEFVLGQGTIPHITIYQAIFPIKNFQKVKRIVKEISSQTRSFEIEMGSFSTSAVRGFIPWNSIKTENLTRIHLEMINRVNPLRKGLIPDGLKNYLGPEEIKKDIENYGSLLVNKHYSPHITITRLKRTDDSEKALEILGENKSKFTADKIVLGYLGPHGTVTEIIEEFPLAV